MVWMVPEVEDQQSQQTFFKIRNIDIQISRLGLNFAVASFVDDEGNEQLRFAPSQIQNWFVKENEDDEVSRRLLTGLPHAIILENSQHELSILVSSAKLVRPKVHASPLSCAVFADRENSIVNCFYHVPIHCASLQLVPTSFDMAAYLV